MSRTLSGLRREGGISLVIPHWKRASARVEGQSPGFSQVAAGFLSTYDGDLKDPLVGLQGGPVSTRVASGPSGFLCNRCWCRGPHLELRPESQGFLQGRHRSQASSGASTGESGPRLVWCHARPLSSRPGKAVSLPVGLTIMFGGFPFRGNRAVTPAVVF